MKFDENLRELRKEKGYSQEELAYKLEVTRQTVSKWENGSAMPDLKKLTELAEFFGVSMDDLLGIENGGNSANRKESDFEIYSQYIDQRISAFEAAQKNEKNKDIKVLSFLLGIAVGVIAIWAMIFTGYVKNSFNNLDYSVRFLQSQINSYNYPSGGIDNYWESKSDDVTVSFLSVDPEKPYIVNAELKYSPTSYTKGSKVYFSIPKEDKSIERLEATEKNGEFVLTTDIDLTIDGEFYFFLDDGDEIVKEELYVDPVNLYCEFESYSGGDIYYSVEEQWGINGYYLRNAFSEYELSWSGIAANEIVNAEFVVENNGEEVFTEKLDFKKRDDLNKYIIEINNYSLPLNDPLNLKIYIRITDSIGIVYKHYTMIDAPYSDESSEISFYYGSLNTLVFDVEGKGAVEVNFY